MGIQYHTRIANVTYIHVPRYQYRYGTSTGAACVRARARMDRRSNYSLLLVLFFLIPQWLRSVTPSPHAAGAQRLTQLRAGPRVSVSTRSPTLTVGDAAPRGAHW